MDETYTQHIHLPTESQSAPLLETHKTGFDVAHGMTLITQKHLGGDNARASGGAVYLLAVAAAIKCVFVVSDSRGWEAHLRECGCKTNKLEIVVRGHVCLSLGDQAQGERGRVGGRAGPGKVVTGEWCPPGTWQAAASHNKLRPVAVCRSGDGDKRGCLRQGAC